MKQNYINHVALVIDRSGSMNGLTSTVVQVVDNQISHLAKRSKELDQETRITVYTFDDRIECLVYDKDVLRMPSMKGLFHPRGATALIDATLKAIDDLSHTPQLYGDHAFLTYVLTDGEENRSRATPSALEKRIQGLAENWTIAAFVPNQTGKFEAKKFGFPSDNIAIWDTTSKGLAEVGETIRAVTDQYMTNRSVGVRGTKNLFNLSTVKTGDVAAALPKLHPGQYRIAEVDETGPIAAFVEDLTKRAYKMGEAFYQLTKTEKVQAQKSVALRNKKTSAVYTGPSARQLLGLPDHEVKVAPASHPDFDIFIQSTSVNRKLVAGTKLLLIS